MKRIVVILMGALSFVLGAASCASVRPVAAQPVALSDERMLPYASPGLLIDIGGRQINLHCMGAGEPTVILMSGIASWSPIWYKVQPEIAARTRVCTFDRAGYGFSDPAPRPQVLSDAADDLHAALAASALRAPYVLVGHSMGGVEARLYAQRWPSEVAGMVLVDTSPAGEGLINEQQPGFDEAMGREYYASNKLHCALLAADGPLPASSPDYGDCALPLPGDAPAALREAWPRFFTAYYAATQASLMTSLYTHRYDCVDRSPLGAIPLVVLSPEQTWNPGTPEGAAFGRAYAPVWIGMHEALAQLSSRGEHRFIAESGHSVQLDKPEAVIDAIDDVLQQLD